jgi:tRNA (mo5U34)-methyltransferase
MPGDRPFRHVHDLRTRRDSLGWWHSFELPDGTTIEGTVSLKNLRLRVAQFPIPPDLRGKRVLDIGAWDGWFSFEMERRGAEVVAIDVWDNPRFREMRSILGSKVDFRVMDVYDLDPSVLGRFDIVLFLGVLYHLKHPLLALERVCSMTTELAAVDSFVLKRRRGRGRRLARLPMMEFFESDEFGGQTDNWVAPTIPCLMSLCRTAGFARVELRNELPTTAALACFRRWDDAVDPGGKAPRLAAARHNTNNGINVSSRRDDYLTAWFEGPTRDLARGEVHPDVGGLGTIPINTGRRGPESWETTFKLPPGLTPGWHPVRLRVGQGPPSNEVRVAVDVPLPDATATITGVADGTTWSPNAVDLSLGNTLCLWVEGLPENADSANVRVLLDARPIAVTHVDTADPAPGPRQVNVEIPADLPAGSRHVRVALGHRESAPVRVDVRRD